MDELLPIITSQNTRGLLAPQIVSSVNLLAMQSRMSYEGGERKISREFELY